MRNAPNVDDREIDYFDGLAAEWWNPKGVFATLQRMTPARAEYIGRSVARLLAHDGDGPGGLNIIDIGCGGGLLAEPLARMGASVTGIDASREAIDAARHHAKLSGLAIDYHAMSTDDFAAQSKKTFDVIIASEVIEHVPDRVAFLKSMTRFGNKDAKKQSAVIITTINRSLAGVALGKYAAEYILRLAPKGAHDPRRLVKPAELRREAEEAGIRIDDITGINITPLMNFTLGGPPMINYAGSGLVLRRQPRH